MKERDSRKPVGTTEGSKVGRSGRGVPTPVEIKRVRKGLIANGLRSGRCEGKCVSGMERQRLAERVGELNAETQSAQSAQR